MKKTTMISLLLLSTVAVTPAFANWFANPRTNTMLNVGSAPSPTPEDLRKIGDSRYASNAPVIIHEPPLASATPSTVVGEPVVLVPQMRAADVEYRPVIGVGGQRLGAIIAFDETMQQAELQLSTGVAVSMPATGLAGRPDEAWSSPADVPSRRRSRPSSSMTWSSPWPSMNCMA